MGRMQIVYRSIKDILPYEKNPRINDEAVPVVKESIKEFGFRIPIVIDVNDVIVAGHTRVKAAKELGMEEVPCTIADDLTEEQIKAFRLIDNKSAEIATWDEELLQQELSEILDIDMSMFGFEEGETDFADEIEDNTYTMKTNIPQYEITGECPTISEMLDKEKSRRDYGGRKTVPEGCCWQAQCFQLQKYCRVLCSCNTGDAETDGKVSPCNHRHK